MITLPSKTYTADAIRLSQILSSTTKVNMLKVCKKFDLYVSPNLKKDETACRIANEEVYFDLALQGKKGPSAKDLRMMAFMKNLYGQL